jgi:hypothetical protein
MDEILAQNFLESCRIEEEQIHVMHGSIFHRLLNEAGWLDVDIKFIKPK